MSDTECTSEVPPAEREIARGRVSQVFRFLKELNGLRNPVPRDLTAYPEVFHIRKWPAHPCVEIMYGDRADEPLSMENDEERSH